MPISANSSESAFATLWTELGGSADGAGSVSFAGPDRVYPSVFPVVAFAAATIAAAMAAGTEVGRLRGLPAQRVAIDAERAAAAFRSDRLFRIGGAAPVDLWDPFAGHYRAGDGRWLQLHTNFPHHRAAALGILSVATDATRTEAEAAIGARPADEVVEAIVAAGGCAALLRSPEEWADHPQAASLAGEPLVSWEPAAGRGESFGRPVGPLPQSGVRVLDLTRVLAGPVCGRTLAALGADVLRVGGASLPTFPAIDLDTGFGKRFAHLDLRTSAGVSKLRELAVSADVVVDAFRPGALARLGLGAADLHRANPGLVHISIDAWGWTGPWAGRRGFDSLVQTGTGIVAEEWTAAATERPRPLPCQALDHGTGYLAAAAACLALARRIRTGEGGSARLSLAATGRWLSGMVRVPDGGRTPEPDLLAHVVDVDTPMGRLTHVGPIAELSHTPLRWDVAPPVPGGDAAVWL